VSLQGVAILISGAGSNMAALVAAMQAGTVAARPVLVLANRPDAPGPARARAAGVPAEALDHRAFASREAFEDALHARLLAAGADLVCLAGFLRILTPSFVARWPGRLLNIHPSLLPLFPGLDTHARALAAGVCLHGATVHEVTAALDAGPILGQGAVPVRDDDTADTLGARVLAMEHRLYPAVLARFLRGERGRLALFP
jgi:phosphoribosylglycinamide formyltransferase-1